MKTLIVYAGRYGSTADAVALLAEALGGQVTVADVEEQAPGPEGFDCVVLGGGVYAGSFRKALKQYAGRHADKLAATRLGLFVCCSEPSPAQDKYLGGNLPEVLVASAVASASLGGEYRFERMDPVTRFILRRIAGNRPMPALDREEIGAFAAALQAAE